MTDLLATNTALRFAILTLIFAIAAVAAYGALVLAGQRAAWRTAFSP